eukprot:5335461-Amphidinium_carterae.1
MRCTVVFARVRPPQQLWNSRIALQHLQKTTKEKSSSVAHNDIAHTHTPLQVTMARECFIRCSFGRVTGFIAIPSRNGRQ